MRDAGRAGEEEAVDPEASGQDAAALGETAADALASGDPGLLGAALGQLPVGIAVLGPELRGRYVNEAFRRATGLGADDLPGAGGAALREVLADGRARVVAVGRAGLRARGQRLLVDGRVAGLLLVLPQVGEEPDEPGLQRRELEQARTRLALLDAAADRIGTTLDVATTCAELADFTVPRLADLASVEVLPPEAMDRGGATHADLRRLRRTGLAVAPALRPHLEALAVPGESVRHQEGSAVARALETGKPVIGNLLSEEELGRSATDPATLAGYRAAGIDSVLVVPLRARGHLVGVLSLARVGGASAGFTDDDVVLVDDLACRAAIGIDNAHRYSRSQGIALQLQRALLSEPGSPHPNLELASRYLPSGTSSMVGGDWYETVRLPFGRTLLVMGDVMGHGVEAAVDMSSYRSMLRYVAAMDLPPHRILRQLDTLISAQESARPATCLLALADPGRNRWTFSSAGHLPPALIAADRPTELITVPTGPPLGTGLGGYEQGTHQLLAEQVLLLYTDGLVERRGEDIDVSLDRLAALRPPVTGELDDLLDAVLHSLAHQAAEDDIALLAARVRPR